MTKQRLEWVENGYDHVEELAAENPGKRYIGVDDDHVCHWAELPAGMTAEEALADYASDYDATGYKGNTVLVNWRLYENGAAVGLVPGEWSFPADRRSYA